MSKFLKIFKPEEYPVYEMVGVFCEGLQKPVSFSEAVRVLTFLYGKGYLKEPEDIPGPRVLKDVS